MSKICFPGIMEYGKLDSVDLTVEVEVTDEQLSILKAAIDAGHERFEDVPSLNDLHDTAYDALVEKCSKEDPDAEELYIFKVFLPTSV